MLYILQFLKCSESGEMEQRLEQYNAWVMLEKEDTCPHGLLHIARWVYVLYTKANWYHIPGDNLLISVLLHPCSSLSPLHSYPLPLPPSPLSYRALKEYRSEEVQRGVDALSSSLTSIYDPHRLTVVAFYSEVTGVCVCVCV